MDADEIADRLITDLDGRLADADAALAAAFPGNPAGRQPIHTVYVPAHRYAADSVPAWGAEALEAIAARAELFAELVDDEDVVARVRAKLTAEPIEDLRIDFEDGYDPSGRRGDDAEDADAERAARDLARALADGTASPFHGIRFKSFEAPTRRRGLRTLTRFVATLAEAGAPLDGFVTTLPKVTSVDQVRAMVHACTVLEADLGLGTGALRFEIQVETPQSILGPDGSALVARMIHASEGRCTALHYGTYDYSAFCGIAAPYQSMAHPVADHAKLIMQAAAAGTGVRLSDGSTNVLPVGDAEAVRAGWRLHLDLVRRSLEHGYYQGWDLHPAQLPTRYAATIAFYRAGLGPAVERLRRYFEHTGGAVLDEPATARALADFVLRALHCGATSPDEVRAGSGLELPVVTALARPGR